MVFGLLSVHAQALDSDDVQAEELIGEFIPGDVHQEILTPDAIAAENVGSGNLPGGTYYVLDANAPVDGGTYLIVSGNSGNAYALRNNNQNSGGSQSVTFTDGVIKSGFTNESSSTWTFNVLYNGNWNIKNGSRYIYLGSNSTLTSTSTRELAVEHLGDGAYTIRRPNSYYLRWNVGKIFCVYRLTKGTDAYYMVSELDVIPATVMYYETDFATGVFTTTDWTTQSEGDAADGPQDDGTIGQNTYGYDDSYTNDALLSNGSSLYAEGAGVNATTATFSFTGTGFDLISRTGAEQGLIKVQVFTDAKMTNVERTVTVLNKSESSLELYQIPVVSINGLEHGTYYVKIGVDVCYSNADFAALYRGNQFYFDAIRIYDPAKGNAIAEAAYNADGEANSILTEVRESLISANDFNAQTEGSDGVVYVDSTYTNGSPDHQTGNVVEVADYKKVGPNNEVYLSKGQAIAFWVKANSTPASFDIGAKSISGATAGLSVTVTNSTKNWSVTQEIASSTVQFIDLLSSKDAVASEIYKGAYVVITNTGEGVLSITDLKTAFSVNAASIADMDEIRGGNELSVMSLSAAADPFAVSYTVDASTLDVARMVLCGDEEPEIPEIPETPVKPGVDASDYAIMDATLKVIGRKKNQKCTFTIVIKQTVEFIEIAQNSEELIPTSITFKDKKNGIRTWTIVLTFGDYDSHSFFVVTGIGEDGVRGQPVSVHNIKSR